MHVDLASQAVYLRRMSAWTRRVLHGPAAVALLIVTLVGAAGAGAIAATSGADPHDGVRGLAVAPRVSLATLATRGVTVHLRVSSDERSVRLRLIRTSGRRIVVTKTFRLPAAIRPRVRWRPGPVTMARLRAGRYVLEATAGDAHGDFDGTVRRTVLRLVGPRSPGAPAAGTPTPGPGGAPQPRPTAARPCGLVGTAPAWRHVVWIVMENTGYSELVGAAQAPFLNALGAKCGLATNFFAETHPSLPNYIAMTSGSTQGVTDNDPPSAHPLAVPSIFSQLGSDWRSLQESMPSNCPRKTSGEYAVKHDPAAYYTNIPCATQDVPLTDPPDLSARFTFITPNLCNSMHDCSIAIGDTWLSQWVPKLIDSPEYQAGSTAIFVTWDEDGGNEGNHIATYVVAPSVPAGTQAGARFDHYAMLRTAEEMLGLPATLGAAATAPSMRGAFGL